MEKDNNILNDDLLRELMQGAKLKASKNLQHRIMHRIETEHALKPKKVKSARPMLTGVLGTAAVFYILILALFAVTYYLGGLDAFKTTEFLLATIGLSSACAIYALIIVLDEKRYLK